MPVVSATQEAEAGELPHYEVPHLFGHPWITSSA